MQRAFRSFLVIGAAAAIVTLATIPTGVVTPRSGEALAAGPAAAQSPRQVAPGLVLPPMDPVRGKELFASKGCVVCHSINKVGGRDAPALDASTMAPTMDPFDFAAKMWRGAVPMIMMQQKELGHQIEFTGQNLADIVAFVHNRAVQQTFSTADIPPEIKKLIDESGDEFGVGHDERRDDERGDDERGDDERRRDDEPTVAEQVSCLPPGPRRRIRRGGRGGAARRP